MIKIFLYGLFVGGLLFGCSHHEDRVSATADSSSKDTTASVLDTKEVSSPYIDTLLITFSDNQPYTIYVEEYSKEGPEGSLRHFVMVDPQGKEVFRSFEKTLHLESDDAEEEIDFDVIPYYTLLIDSINNNEKLAIGLNYTNLDDSDSDIKVKIDEIINSNDFDIIRPSIGSDGYYVYGYLRADEEKITFLSTLPTQSCAAEFGSLIYQYGIFDSLSLDAKYNLQDNTLLCIFDTTLDYKKRRQMADSLSSLLPDYMYNYYYAIPIFVAEYITYNFSFSNI